MTQAASTVGGVASATLPPHVGRSMDEQTPRPFWAYWSECGKQVYGPRRATAAEARADYEARVRAPARPREFVDVERQRGKQITKSLRKTGFTDAQKREAKTRDEGCVGGGRYGECAGTQPLELCQVDHVDPDGPNALWNAQTLCGNCHDWKTAVENGWWTP